MRKVFIKSPIWKTRSIGIADYHFFRDPEVEFHITYEDKSGKKLYPNTYLVSKEEAIKYPIQRINRTVRLYIIPIKEMRVK